jgi:hypothetical protein
MAGTKASMASTARTLESTLESTGVLNLTSDIMSLTEDQQVKVLGKLFHLKPELRQRMADQSELPHGDPATMGHGVKSWSTASRQGILKILPPEDRQVGSQMLGHGHVWRTNKTGRHSADHPDFRAGQMRMEPTLARSPQYSFSKTTRFPNPGFSEEKTLTYKNWATPGPGHYMPSRTPYAGYNANGSGKGISYNDSTGHPHMDGIAFGPNHTYPWKDVMGQTINPVGVDTKLKSSPKPSFGRMRRCASDVQVSYGTQAVKSDEGNLSPGPIYPHWTTFGLYGPT